MNDISAIQRLSVKRAAEQRTASRGRKRPNRKEHRVMQNNSDKHPAWAISFHFSSGYLNNEATGCFNLPAGPHRWIQGRPVGMDYLSGLTFEVALIFLVSSFAIWTNYTAGSLLLQKLVSGNNSSQSAQGDDISRSRSKSLCNCHLFFFFFESEGVPVSESNCTILRMTRTESECHAEKGNIELDF